MRASLPAYIPGVVWFAVMKVHSGTFPNRKLQPHNFKL
jgi:hypothetical protein